MLWKVRLSAVAALMLAMACPGLGEEPVVVIVHKSNELTRITAAELKRIYRGKQERWDDGQRIMVVDQPLESTARESFYESMLGRDPATRDTKANSPARFKPRVRRSDRSVMRLVGQFPNAIGYIHESAADDRVRILNIEGGRAGTLP